MPYGSIDLPAHDNNRTVGSKCHVLHSKWRQSFKNDSISVLSSFSLIFFALIIDCKFSVVLRELAAAADEDDAVAVKIIKKNYVKRTRLTFGLLVNSYVLLLMQTMLLASMQHY